ncbi:MAG: radical SAM protein [Deltaproteobacteria bacterium]|nr:radical SAM protein [Deltaproteobacteria bacterium]
MFELANACNHRCFFCALADSTRKAHILDFSLMEKLLRQAFLMGIRSVGMYGCGEPFIVPDLARRVVLAKKIGFTYVYVTTNGGLATKERLREVLDSGLDSLKFSINAGTVATYKEVHGKDDFEKVLDRVRFASTYNKEKLNGRVILSVSCVNSIKNDREIEKLQEILRPYIDEFVAYGMNNQTGHKNNDSIRGSLKSRPQALPCPMIFNRIHIQSEGYISACCEDYQNYLAISDLHFATIENVWKGDVFNNLRVRHLRGDVSGTLCDTCVNGSTSDILPLNDQLYTPFNFNKISSNTNKK